MFSLTFYASPYQVMWYSLARMHKTDANINIFCEKKLLNSGTEVLVS